MNKLVVQSRAEELGQLIADAPLPKETVAYIRQRLAHLSLVEVDLLIAALHNAERVWSQAETVLEQSVTRLQDARELNRLTNAERAQAIVDNAVAEAEQTALREVKQRLADA